MILTMMEVKSNRVIPFCLLSLGRFSSPVEVMDSCIKTHLLYLLLEFGGDKFSYNLVCMIPSHIVTFQYLFTRLLFLNDEISKEIYANCFGMLLLSFDQISCSHNSDKLGIFLSSGIYMCLDQNYLLNNHPFWKPGNIKKEKGNTISTCVFNIFIWSPLI